MIVFLIIISILEAITIALLALWAVYLYKAVTEYRKDEYDNIPLEPINVPTSGSNAVRPKQEIWIFRNSNDELDYYPESILDGGSKDE